MNVSVIIYNEITLVPFFQIQMKIDPLLILVTPSGLSLGGHELCSVTGVDPFFVCCCCSQIGSFGQCTAHFLHVHPHVIHGKVEANQELSSGHILGRAGLPCFFFGQVIRSSAGCRLQD